VGTTEILGTGDRVSYERRFEKVDGRDRDTHNSRLGGLVWRNKMARAADSRRRSGVVRSGFRMAHWPELSASATIEHG